MVDNQKSAVLLAIEDYKDDLDSFHDNWWDGSYAKGRVIWTLNMLRELVLKSDKPPLVVLEDFVYDMQEYARLNDIWRDCIISTNSIIRRLV